MATRFKGIYPAILTPFADEDRIDFDAFAGLVDWLYKAGVDGLYVGGNTGQWYLQTVEERKALARAAVELSRGRGKVIVHVGTTATRDAVELARDAERAGADAIGSLPPYTARPAAQEIIEYYRRLASSTGLPCFVYYFPAVTGAVAIESLCALPGITGVKFTDMNLYELGQLAERSPAGLTLLNGHDQVLMPALAMGAHGGVGSFYNVIPEEFVGVWRAWCAGDLACAQRRQRSINRLIRVTKQYRLVPALRFLLGLQGLVPGIERGPSLPLAAAERTALEREVSALATVSI
jgi:N-acetylneuraminate lyase